MNNNSVPDTELQEQLLGSRLLSDPESLPSDFWTLEPRAFTNPEVRRVFAAAIRLRDQAIVPDYPTYAREAPIHPDLLQEIARYESEHGGYFDADRALRDVAAAYARRESLHAADLLAEEMRIEHPRFDEAEKLVARVRALHEHADTLTTSCEHVPLLLPAAEPRGGAYPQWPISPADEAYDGLAGEIVRAIEPHTEADPVAILAQFLAAFGNLVGRGPHFQVEADRHHANLYVVLVGPTGKGRKGTSWGYVIRFLGDVDPAWKSDRLLSGIASGEGLVYAVRDPNELAEDAGVTDKRLFVFEPEYASQLRTMGREGSILSPILRQAWDSGDISRLPKNDPLKATGAHISIVGHITKEELARTLARTELANGFANRHLWICAKRSKLLPDGGKLTTSLVAAFLPRLKAAVDAARRAALVVLSDEARRIWRHVYPDLSEGHAGLLGAATSRAEPQTLRLALVYALFDGETTIQARHLVSALALWDYVEESARFIFGDALGNPIADAILKELRIRPAGMTRTDIRNFFGHNRSQDEITGALIRLAENGLARVSYEKTRGRDSERWHALLVYDRNDESQENDATINDRNDHPPSSVVSVVGRKVVGGE